MIYLDSGDSRPLYQQLYQKLTQEILSGRMEAGSRLPPSRSLAEELGISRNTVNRVYQQLLAEGYVVSRMGSGFYVSEIDPDLVPEAQSWKLVPIPDPPAYRYHFFYGTISSSVFPHDAWRKSVNNALTAIEYSDFIGYPVRQGESALRESIVRYLHTSRGVECQPDQVVITGGHQHSMEILARMFREQSDTFAIEEPGYDGVRAVFENYGYKVAPVPVEKDGIDLTALEPVRAGLFYLTPSHQFPLGCLLPVAKRLAILSWARSTGCYIIEDDYDSELWYSHTPVPCMQSLDPGGRVIFASTFSKCLSPNLRVAYMVLPRELLPLYYRHYQRYNTQVSPLIQEALADFLDSGGLLRHIARLRTYYRRQRAAFLEALYETFGGSIQVYGEDAGLQVVVDFRLEVDGEELIASAARAGIGVYSPIANYVDRSRCPRSMLLMGFANLSEQTNRKALGLLKEQWQKDGLWPRE